MSINLQNITKFQERESFFSPNYETISVNMDTFFCFCFSAFFVFRESFHLDSVVAHIKTHVLQHWLICKTWKFLVSRKEKNTFWDGGSPAP